MRYEEKRTMPDTYNNREQKQIRKNLRRTMPKGERLLWSKLRNNQIGYKFRRQYGINNCILDFYCPTLRLAIEIDGLTHENPTVYARDKAKDMLLKSISITILRIPSAEIFENINEVIGIIYQECKKIHNSHVD